MKDMHIIARYGFLSEAVRNQQSVSKNFEICTFPECYTWDTKHSDHNQADFLEPYAYISLTGIYLF